jgi:undecaprenyl-diphosphatase
MPELADAVETTAVGSAIDRFDARVDAAWGAIFRGHPVADRLFYVASELADFSLIWQIVAVAQGLRDDPKDPEATLRMATALLIESVVVNQGIKRLFHRARPVADEPRPLHLRTPLTSSFPSGHASAAFTAAGILAQRDPSKAPVIYAAALLVAMSRVHVKIHHPTDVLAGAALGAVFARITTRHWPLPVRR